MLPDGRPNPRRLVNFLLIVGLLDLGALVLVAIVAPPDPVTTLYVAGPMLLAAPVLGYLIVYRLPNSPA